MAYLQRFIKTKKNKSNNIIMEKNCNKCSLKKDSSLFFKDSSHKDGLSTICKECKAIYLKKYYQKNEEKIKNQYRDTYDPKNKKKYYEKNKKNILKKRAKYRENNKEKIKSQGKKYRQTEKHKKSRSAYEKNKKNLDKLYKLKSNIRGLIRNSLIYNGFSKKCKTHKILGCSFQEFKIYIESRFQPWMNWDNHGKYNGELNFGWDLDHIVPISSAKTEEEIIKLNHYTNFQPLCSTINRNIKRAYL